MRKLTLALSTAALAIAGAAYAAPGMMMDKDMTKAEAQQHTAEMFKKMDANGDGVLNDADRQARMDKRFDSLDTDKNGAISRAEFAAGHEARMGHGGGDHAKGGHDGHRKGKMGRHGGMMKDMADTNNDGAISSAEFAAHHAAMFDRADADKNGTVTAAERRAARKAMHAAQPTAPDKAK